MEYFNKKAIVSIRLIDESEEPIIKLYKKGSWKKKPGLFSKGEKWEENVFETGWTYRPHRESTLLKNEGLIYEKGKLISLPRISIHFANQSSRELRFTSVEERDEYLKNFNLTDYIKLD